MARSVTNLVGGRRVEAADGRRVDLIDPSTGEVFGSAPVSGPEDVDRAYAAAAAGFDVWRDSTPSERQQALLRFATLMEERAEEIIAAECENTGKPLELTRTEELPPAIDQVRFFAGAARVLEGRSAGEYLRGFTSYVRREPIGVVGQVAPWNYPMMMAIWKLAPAIAAGNAVVLKPSDTTPVSATILAEIGAEVFPPGVLNVICGDRATGRAMVGHKTPAMVSITGSVRAGMDVAGLAATDVKRVHLELGGKAPVIVFDDADIEAAAEGIAAAGFFNAGQDCTAATRVLAGPRIADEVADALAAQARSTHVGPPADPEAAYGPLNNARQLDHVGGLLDRLPEHAQVLAGGAQAGHRGYFWQPTVVAGLEQADEASQTEIFGPVITVQRFTDEDEAVRWANGVQYGLSSSVWTTNHGRAMRMTRRLDFGCVWVNCHIPLVAEMPHGGFKHSGYGKDLSIYGLEDYTRIKHVMHNLDS